jgi:tetratricopeptide (TPR) repeat protein
MLVVLDNARDTEHVRPLLPGAPGCLVLVTSRDQLNGLVANEQAHPVTLDVLTPTESRELLAHRLGPDRVAAEPGAAAEIITRCARLPLALAIVAARAATHPTFPLATFAGELRADPISGVRAVFSWSYHTLDTGAARLFRLLGLHPGPDVTAAAAASLAGLPIAEARQAIAELTRAQLLVEHTPDRYLCHDLLRAYAAERTRTDDTETERREATRRMLDHCQHTAHTAALLVDPHRADSIDRLPASTGVACEHLDGFAEAMAWFAAERQVLLAMIEHAARDGFETHCWRLAWSLADYRTQDGYRQEVATALDTALCAARRSGDLLGQALVQRLLGCAQILLGRFDDARVHFRLALDLHAELGGHHPAVGLTHRSLGVAAQRQGHHQDALDHARQALEADRAAGDRVAQARSLNALGWCHALVGNHRKALELCEQALARYREIDDPVGEAAALDSVGYAHHHLDQYEQAIDHYRRALDLYRSFRYRFLEGDTLDHLGDTYHAIGDRDAAREAWQQALAIFTDFDRPDAEDVRTKLTGRAR